MVHSNHGSGHLSRGEGRCVGPWTLQRCDLCGSHFFVGWRYQAAQEAMASSSVGKTPKRLRMPTILKVLVAKEEGLTSLVSPQSWRVRRRAPTTAPMPEESMKGICSRSRMR